jgi:hypothetical protein
MQPKFHSVDNAVETVGCCEEANYIGTNDSSIPAEGVEIWTRVTPGEEYVKVTVRRGRMVGAVLIGDTGLEEVCENLIMNALDISSYGIHILNPDLDLEDFFD